MNNTLALLRIAWGGKSQGMESSVKGLVNITLN